MALVALLAHHAGHREQPHSRRRRKPRRLGAQQRIARRFRREVFGAGMDHRDRRLLPQQRPHLVAAEAAAGGEPIAAAQVAQQGRQVGPPHLNAVEPAEAALASRPESRDGRKQEDRPQQQGMHAEHQPAAGQPPGQLQQEPGLAGEPSHRPGAEATGGEQVAGMADLAEGVAHLEAEPLNATATAHVVGDQQDHVSRAS